MPPPDPDPVLVARLRAAGCVWAEDEARLLVEAGADDAQRERLVARRVAGEPLETVLGWALLDGVRVRVAPGVFVPRARSGLLVDLAVDLLPPGGLAVDLGCGSGALAAALLARRPDAEVWAVDLDPVAVACARTNLDPARVLEGDLWSPLPDDLRGRVDLALANAPYVPTAALATMPAEARDHEPGVALDGGADGLDVQRRVVAGLDQWLAPGGRLVVETGRRQAAATSALLSAGASPLRHPSGACWRARVETDDERAATAVVAWRQGA